MKIEVDIAPITDALVEGIKVNYIEAKKLSIENSADLELIIEAAVAFAETIMKELVADVLEGLSIDEFHLSEVIRKSGSKENETTH